MFRLFIITACLFFTTPYSAQSFSFTGDKVSDKSLNSEVRYSNRSTIHKDTLQETGHSTINYVSAAEFTSATLFSSSRYRGSTASLPVSMSAASMPSEHEVRISFVLPQEEWVQLEVSDMLGNRRCTIMYENMESGLHHFQWKGGGDLGISLPPGVYICSLRIGEHIQLRKRVELFPE